MKWRDGGQKDRRPNASNRTSKEQVGNIHGKGKEPKLLREIPSHSGEGLAQRPALVFVRGNAGRV